MPPMRFILLGLLALLSACNDSDTPAPGTMGSFGPDAPQTLRADFEAVVTRIQQSKDPAVARQALEAYLLEEKDFLVLFGPELGARAWPGYRDVVAGKLREEAGAVLVREIVQNGRTEVRVEGVGPAYPAATTRGDQALLDALKARRPLFTVRLQKPGETLGLRLNGFIFHEGKWRVLLKAYEHFGQPAAAVEEGDEGEAPASEAPASVAPASEAPASEAPASVAPASEAPATTP
jgi:hypothetical protein